MQAGLQLKLLNRAFKTMVRKNSPFEVTVSSGVIHWDPVDGLSGPSAEVSLIRKSLDWSEVVVGGTGPRIRLEESDPYAVILVVEQLFDEPVYSDDAPTLEDILGPWDPEAIY